ncbi:hypothetical protein M758_UG089000 [Ceratodon purpureus]|nr:hypothetical protein M758_UG089000 [Ceratodon purpureus]
MDNLGGHDGIATLRCLNAAMYTHWCNRRGVPCLGKLIDFIPHTRSLAGSNPIAAARTYNHWPTREVIAEKITALKNKAPSPPQLSQFEATLQAVEGHLKSHISTIGTEITTHTTTTIDTATAQATHLQQTHHDYIRQQLHLLTSASKSYSDNIGGIFSALTSGPADGPPHPPSRSPPSLHPPRLPSILGL